MGSIDFDLLDGTLLFRDDCFLFTTNSEKNRGLLQTSTILLVLFFGSLYFLKRGTDFGSPFYSVVGFTLFVFAILYIVIAIRSGHLKGIAAKIQIKDIELVKIKTDEFNSLVYAIFQTHYGEVREVQLLHQFSQPDILLNLLNRLDVSVEVAEQTPL